MQKIRLEAHRGVSSEYPENTLAAFQAAVDEGYDMIELDPKCTKDGHFLILHDRTVNRTGRTADGVQLSEPAPIQDMTLAEAQLLEYGSWKAPQFKGEPIPTLEKLIQFVKQNNIAIKMDSVWQSFTEEQQNSFLTQLQNADLGAKLGFTCDNFATLQKIASRFPQVELHWDGANDEDTLKSVRQIAANHRLTIWLCLDTPMTNWYKGTKATTELAQLAHKYAEVGIWILSKQNELHEAVQLLKADIIETTGHIKKSMIN